MIALYIFSARSDRYALKSHDSVVGAFPKVRTYTLISLFPVRSCRESPQCTRELVSDALHLSQAT